MKKKFLRVGNFLEIITKIGRKIKKKGEKYENTRKTCIGLIFMQQFNATMMLERKNMADDEYISRNEHNAFASDVDHEQTRQNKRIEALEVTVRQINDLTLSVQKLAINMEHMLVNQTEQSKRLEELENRDGEKWRSISMYVLTAVVGAVLGFVLKQAGL